MEIIDKITYNTLEITVFTLFSSIHFSYKVTFAKLTQGQSMQISSRGLQLRPDFNSPHLQIHKFLMPANYSENI